MYPFQADRLQILHALSRDVHVSNRAFTLAKLASLTSGFTGADLQALLYTARLALVKENLLSKSCQSPHLATGELNPWTRTWKCCQFFCLSAFQTNLKVSQTCWSTSTVPRPRCWLRFRLRRSHQIPLVMGKWTKWLKALLKSCFSKLWETPDHLWLRRNWGNIRQCE